MLLAADGGEWRSSTIREGLVAVWRWPEGESERPRCVVYLSGVAGWAGESVRLVPRDRGVEVVGAGATVHVACPDQAAATLGGHPAPLDERQVWLISGLGADDRGPAVRSLAALEGSFERGGDVATELYDASSDLRAAIYYNR